MKNIYLITIFSCLSIATFAQTSKQKTPVKQAIAGNTPKTPVTKSKSVEKAPPPPVLTMAERRKINTDDMLGFLISCGDMFSDEKNLYSDLRNYTEYTDLSDTSATILLKNKFGHTTDRIVVTYDSARVKRMVQHNTKKKSYSAPDNNAVWIPQIEYSYFFTYDPANAARVVTIGRANAGLEDKDYLVNKYLITWRNDGVDSVECIEPSKLKVNCVYYNGKKRPERINRYSFQAGNPNPISFVEYTWNYKYDGFNSKEREQLYQPPTKYPGVTKHRMTLSDKGAVNKTFVIKSDANYGGNEVLLNTYDYDATGNLMLGKEYKTTVYSAASPSAIDSAMVTIVPRECSYVYNDHKQVTQRKISFHDKCEDSEEVIDYSIGAYGFVTETKSKRTVNVKCRY